ncbi:hypothetical protein FQN57_004254 [Myotisia sp. PD_48]|nr:hypothetical protein FQN57_004254 [Myotisia sp. PD_48]
MESQDGISVRPMRLKVLYTFDDESKTNCLARWPHLLDIQTAFLDETTEVGVIELKTCIQSIVSASPELVAKLGRDYTVYAYDYSEYETPLVGQGMLSWVLASASPTPNAPAHQSKTIVTGRVCKNSGLFARGAQETLEVKLKLVPVPTVLQSEYLESMQKYRDLSNVIPHDFDAQAWTSFLQANPNLLSANTPEQYPDIEPLTLNRSGLEKLQELLSDGATPRELPVVGPESYRAESPAQYSGMVPSRTSTPGLSRATSQQQKRGTEEIRPGSRGSIRNSSFQRPTSRRGSILSGYGSAEEVTEGPAPKRAKLLRTNSSGSVNTNIERQPNSLRVAASTAASVRIHRPTPVNPATNSLVSAEDPVRPPTPVPSQKGDPNRRRIRAGNSSLKFQASRMSEVNNFATPDSDATSPDEPQYCFPGDTPAHMPSSPPVMEARYPLPSSPALPHLPSRNPSFIGGGFDSLIDDDNYQDPNTCPIPDITHNSVETAPSNNLKLLQPAPPRQLNEAPDTALMSESCIERQAEDDAFNSLPNPPHLNNSRASSKSNQGNPANMTPLSPQHTASIALHNPQAIASEPIQASKPWQPKSQPATHKLRNGAGARRTKQVQARLEQCIREGLIPPFCENCGAIETPTWRRAHSKVFQGTAKDAQAYNDDPTVLFSEVNDTDENGAVKSFKIFKKSLLHNDVDYVQLLMCNPCGLWLYKFKTMRPEHRWNKAGAPKEKQKRGARAKPLETRARRKARVARGSQSSAPASEVSSPDVDDGTTSHAEEDVTPQPGEAISPPVEHENGNKSSPNETEKFLRRRANSAEPAQSIEPNGRWQDQHAFEALRRAIQSSPARNMDASRVPLSETQLTPKPLRRALFATPKNGSTMKNLSEAFINGIRRSPRGLSKQGTPSAGQENTRNTRTDNFDELFEAPEGDDVQIMQPGSPTPTRRNNVLRRSPRRRSPKSTEDDGRIPTLSLSPTSKSYEAMDSMLMSFLTSDIDSFPQTDSLFPFDPPKTPSGKDWANWDPEGFPSSIQTRSRKRRQMMDTPKSKGQSRAAQPLAGDDVEITQVNNNNPQTPRRARSAPIESPFKSFLEELNGTSAFPGSDIFDPSIADPELMNLWSRDANISNELDQIDSNVLSAIMQDGTGNGF